MIYQEAEEYILDIPKFTKKNDLAQTRKFLDHLGNPQDGLKVVHVAGTNGKGSVCAYIDCMLRSEGRKTGLFTSPHLVKLNERIRVGGKSIDDKTFCRAFAEVRQAVDRMEKDGLPHPTFFEFLFGMAMAVFREAGAEYAVLETGLGGRLDATSAVEPSVCVITSIGMDHMQYLGNTIAEIAGEKAGIIRPGVPVFYAGTAPKSDEVIRRTAEENNSFCKKIGKDAYEILGIRDKHIAFSCSSAYYGNTTWKLNNTALCQPGNAVLAMEAARWLLGENGHPDRWREALAKLKWEGRMEEVLPDVYIDGAHNISAVEAFVRSIPKDGKGNIIVFSSVKDKDYAKMAACLCRETEAELFVTARIRDPRGADAAELAEIFRKYTKRPVLAKRSVREAFDFALGQRRGRKVYCLGSFYLAGEIKELLQGGYADAGL